MNDFNVPEALVKIALFYLPLLFALCFHEFAHGWMAKRKQDNTAELMGRLTMNPLAHMDLVGTLILPVAAILLHWPLFGWAKPVPVNPRNLKKPTEDMFWIALAGPLSNIFLGLVGGTILLGVYLFFPGNIQAGAVTEMLKMFIYINFLLAVFNLIPLHPLDGGKVLARFLPYDWNRFLEERQPQMNMALILLFVLGGFHYLAYPVELMAGGLIGFVQSMAGVY